MNRNVPAGTAGTTTTELAPANTLAVLTQAPGKTVYLRSDAPLARDSKVEYGSELKNAYIPTQGNRDPNVRDVSILVKVSEVWDITGDPNGYVYPASAHLVLRFPSHANVSLADVKAMQANLLGQLSDAILTALMRQRTAVQG